MPYKEKNEKLYKKMAKAPFKAAYKTVKYTGKAAYNAAKYSPDLVVGAAKLAGKAAKVVFEAVLDGQ